MGKSVRGQSNDPWLSAIQDDIPATAATTTATPSASKKAPAADPWLSAVSDDLKKKAVTTDLSNGATNTSSPSESASATPSSSNDAQTNTAPTTTTSTLPIQNPYNIATLNGVIQPEGTFKPTPSPVKDLIAQMKEKATMENGVATIHDNSQPKSNLPDIKEAIDATVSDKIKRDRGVDLPNPPSKYEIDAATKIVTESYKRGDLVLATDKSGKAVLKRGTGFVESLVNGIDEAYNAKQEATYFKSLSKDEKTRYLNLKQEFPDVLDPEPTTAPSGFLGKSGNFVGQNANMLATTTTAAIVAPAALPEAVALGAGNFASFLSLVNDTKNGFKNNYEKVYYDLKKQGLPDSEAADKAEVAGDKGQLTQLAENAAFSGTIHAPDLAAFTPAVDGVLDGIVKSAGNLLKHEVPKMAAISAAGSLADNAALHDAGVKVDPLQAMKDAVAAGGEGAILAASFWALHEPVRVPSYLRPQFANVAASIPVEARESLLDKAVETGVSTPEQKIAVSKKINEFGETKAQIADLPIPEAKKAAITGKLVQAKKIQEEIDSLTPYGASFNDRISQLNAAKENIHADINKMYAADDVFDVEHDSLTGEKPVTSSASKEVTTTPDETLKTDTNNGENTTGNTAPDNTSEAPVATQESQTLPSNESPTPQETATEVPTGNNLNSEDRSVGAGLLYHSGLGIDEAKQLIQDIRDGKVDDVKLGKRMGDASTADIFHAKQSLKDGKLADMLEHAVTTKESGIATKDPLKELKAERAAQSDLLDTLKKKKESEDFKYTTQTTTDALGRPVKSRRLKTADELKASTDKINEAIAKAEQELNDIDSKIPAENKPTVDESQVQREEIEKRRQKELSDVKSSSRVNLNGIDPNDIRDKGYRKFAARYNFGLTMQENVDRLRNLLKDSIAERTSPENIQEKQEVVDEVDKFIKGYKENSSADKVNNINAKYDAELADLNKKQANESQVQSTEKPIVKADEGANVNNEPVTSKEESGANARASEDKQAAITEAKSKHLDETFDKVSKAKGLHVADVTRSNRDLKSKDDLVSAVETLIGLARDKEVKLSEAERSVIKNSGVSEEAFAKAKLDEAIKKVYNNTVGDIYEEQKNYDDGNKITLLGSRGRKISESDTSSKSFAEAKSASDNAVRFTPVSKEMLSVIKNIPEEYKNKDLKTLQTLLANNVVDEQIYDRKGLLDYKTRLTNTYSEFAYPDSEINNFSLLKKVSKDIKTVNSFNHNNSVTTNTNNDASNKSEVPQQEVPKQSSKSEHAQSSTEQNTEATKTTDSHSNIGGEGQQPKKKVSRTKFSASIREKADNIEKEGILPFWLKANLPEGTQSAGFGERELTKAFTTAMRIAADAIDTGAAFKETIDRGVEHLRIVFYDNKIPFDEKTIRNGFKEEVKKLAETNGKTEGEWTSVRKEKLQEIEGVKKEFEKRTSISWNETYGNALKKVQERYPNKPLYEAVRSRVNEFVVRLNNKELFNPTSEDIAVFNVFRAETQKRINNIEGMDSNNQIERLAAVAEFDPLHEDLMNVARVTNPNGEAGRAFGMHQSEIKLDPDYGLKIRRMELMRSKGGEKLSPEDLKFTQEKWEQEKEIMKREQEVRDKSMRDEFDARLADLQKRQESNQTESNGTNNKSKPQENKAKLTVDKRKSVADFMRKSADKLENFSRAKGIDGAEIAGVDIQKAIADGMRYVADKIEEGKIKIPDIIADAVVKYGKGNENELRNHIKNELKSAGIDEDLLINSRESSLNKIKEFSGENKATDITNDMVGKNLIRDFVNSHIGEVDQSEILNTAANDLKKVLPDVNKKRLIEAYLKEGEFKQPTKKDLEGGLSEAKKQLSSISKLTEDVEDLNGLKEIRQRSFSTEREKSEYEKKLFDEKNAKVKEITDRRNKINEENRKLATERDRQLKRVTELTDRKNKLEQGIREKKLISPKVDTPEIENLKEQVKKADEDLRKAESEKNRIEKEAQDRKDKIAELDANIKRAIADRDLIKTHKNKSAKQIDAEIEAKQRELKNAVRDNSSEDRVQAKKLEETKKKIAADIKQYQRKIAEGDYEERVPVKLKREDAELIKLQKQRETIQGEYRKKQDDYKEKNKSRFEKVTDFTRSAYVAALIGQPLTFAKVAALAVLRPVSEASTKLTFGKVFDTFFPGISQAAKRGGESSSIKSVQKGFEAYFQQKGKEKIEARYIKAENEYKEAVKKHEDYKTTVSDIKSAYGDNSAEYKSAINKLKSLKDNVNSKLLNAQSNIVYQFIGGSSLKDALGSLVNRSNEIERQFGKINKESLKEAVKFDPDKSKLSNGISATFNATNYVLGFIGRSHSALKTFSGRFSFAAGFMARMEGAVAEGRDISNIDTMLEIAHESYMDWERGKYQQDNAVTRLWNRAINSLEKGESGDGLTFAKGLKFILKASVPITRVPVNVIHEAVIEYTAGAVKAAVMSYNDVSTIRKEITAAGLTPGSLDFKAAMREEISQMDADRAATIARCFRKGGVGAGLYALALTAGCIKFGIFPHLGQKKKKDDSQLAADELNPGQVQIGSIKLGEVSSSVLDHIPALWPMFMGLGMAQAYNDQIKKGKTSLQAIGEAARVHLKVIEGDIPQTKYASPTGLITDIARTATKRATQLGIISDPTKFTDADLKSPAWQLLNGKGLKPPVMQTNNEKLPVGNNQPNRNMTADEFAKFNEQRKAAVEKFVNSAIKSDQKFSGKVNGVAFYNVPITKMTSDQLKSKLKTWEAKASKITKSKMLAVK